MSEKRRGLGRGLGALIPNTTGTKTAGDRPVDVFFPGKTETPPAAPEARATPNEGTPPGETGAESTPAEVPAANGTSTEAVTATVVDLDAAAAGFTGNITPEAPVATDELVPVPGARFAEVPVTSIRPNPRQPRQVFDEEALAELVHSVKEIGVLQPIVVRQVESEGGEARYELIMGERRWRATQEAGLATVPAIIRDTSDDDLLRDALLENLHRSQLNPLEEAAAYQQLLDDFGCTHEDLASRIGRSRPQISNTIRLLRLPPLVQRRVAAGVLSAGHARALLGLDDAAAMERLAQRIVAEGLSVRTVEEIVALGDGQVAKAPKKRPRAGSHTSELNDLASRLGDRFETKVSVALGRSKGRLSIDFASVEDLNRIIGLMAPEVKGAFQEV